MILTFLDKHRDIGLLILRIGFGCLFLFHGLPKLFGGPEKWGKARRRNGDFRYYVLTCVLGIHGCDFGGFGGHLPHPRFIYSACLYPFDNNDVGRCFEPFGPRGGFGRCLHTRSKPALFF